MFSGVVDALASRVLNCQMTNKKRDPYIVKKWRLADGARMEPGRSQDGFRRNKKNDVGS